MIEEIRDTTVRTAHDSECDGWILHGFDTVRQGDKPDEGRAAYRPCELCRPGQHAVWAAGLMIPRIDERPELQTDARELYVAAELAAGHFKRAEHIKGKMKDGQARSQRSKESEDSWV